MLIWDNLIWFCCYLFLDGNFGLFVVKIKGKDGFPLPYLVCNPYLLYMSWWTRIGIVCIDLMHDRLLERKK